MRGKQVREIHILLEAFNLFTSGSGKEFHRPQERKDSELACQRINSFFFFFFSPCQLFSGSYLIKIGMDYD